VGGFGGRVRKRWIEQGKTETEKGSEVIHIGIKMRVVRSGQRSCICYQRMTPR